jgi:D-methionine transport system ATP-binding protein
LRYLKRINEELGITIVLVTHEMDVARMICNRVGVLENGFLIETLNLTNSALTPAPLSKLGKFLFGNGEGI